MYRKALLVLVAGLSLFYGAAFIKHLFFGAMGSIELPSVGIPTPPAQPPIIAPVEARPRIDVVFAIDSTGSMGDEIEVVKENIRNIISDISQGQPAPDVRYGIVTYRDYGDDYVTKFWPFTREVPVIERTLANIRADGGGDKPEAVSDALHVALHNLQWDEQAKSKIVFLIGDAGPNTYPNRYRWEDELKYAQKNNIAINTIACSGILFEEQRVFNEMSNNTNGMFAQLTYKQEYERADGSRATVIEEGGRSYELAETATDDWARGATTLMAKGEAKEMAPPSGYYGAGSVPADTVGGVVGGVASYGDLPVITSGTIVTKPDLDELARDGKAMRSKDELMGKPAAPASPAAAAASAPVVSMGAKTNNLGYVLAESIKTAARKQGITYGSPISMVVNMRGTNSNVKTPRQLMCESKEQLLSLLGSASGIDVNAIDFSNHIVLAAFLGRAGSDAAITITGVYLHNNELIVTVKQSPAGSGNGAPFHIVSIPKQVGSTRLDAKSLFVKFEIN